MQGFRHAWLVLLLVAAAALPLACSSGGSSENAERVYGTPVDPERFFVPPEEPAARDLSKEAQLAQCLTSKGCVLYGADWCSYTKRQIADFGDGFRYLDYFECAGREEVCRGKGVPGYPTWIINGQVFPGYHSLGALAAIAGCD